MRRKTILKIIIGLVLNLFIIAVFAKDIHIVAYNDFHGAVMHFTHNQCDNKSNIEYYEYY